MRSIVEIDEQFRRVIRSRADVLKVIDRKLNEIAELRKGYAAQGQLLDKLMDERLLVTHGNAIAQTIIELSGDPEMDLPPQPALPPPPSRTASHGAPHPRPRAHLVLHTQVHVHPPTPHPPSHRLPHLHTPPLHLGRARASHAPPLPGHTRRRCLVPRPHPPCTYTEVGTGVGLSTACTCTAHST